MKQNNVFNVTTATAQKVSRSFFFFAFQRNIVIPSHGRFAAMPTRNKRARFTVWGNVQTEERNMQKQTRSTQRKNRKMVEDVHHRHWWDMYVYCKANDNDWLHCNDNGVSWCTWTQQDTKHQRPENAWAQCKRGTQYSRFLQDWSSSTFWTLHYEQTAACWIPLKAIYIKLIVFKTFRGLELRGIQGFFRLLGPGFFLYVSMKKTFSLSLLSHLFPFQPAVSPLHSRFLLSFCHYLSVPHPLLSPPPTTTTTNLSSSPSPFNITHALSIPSTPSPSLPPSSLSLHPFFFFFFKWKSVVTGSVTLCG